MDKKIITAACILIVIALGLLIVFIYNPLESLPSKDNPGEDNSFNELIPEEGLTPSENIQEDRLTEPSDERIINRDNTVNLLELTDSEMQIYNNFKQTYNENILSGIDPLSICKLFLYSGSVEDYETEYELLLQEETVISSAKYPVLWTKEEHLEFARGSIEQGVERDLDIFMYATNLEVSYEKDNRAAVIAWNNNDVAPKDANGNSFTFTFRLIKNNNDIWKVQFMPLQ